MAVTLEDKIQLFGKMIIGNIEAESEDMRHKLEGQHQTELDKLKEEIAQKRAELISAAEARGERERKRIISQVRNEEQHRLVAMKQEALQTIMKSLREKAESFTATADYRGYMEKSINSVIRGLVEAKHITIYVAEKDMELCKELMNSQQNSSAELKYDIKQASQNIIGGLIAEDNENQLQIESTLKALIEENRDIVGAAITRRFNEVSG